MALWEMKNYHVVLGGKMSSTDRVPWMLGWLNLGKGSNPEMRLNNHERNGQNPSAGDRYHSSPWKKHVTFLC